MSKPTFSVVAMVREAPDVLERFARHYLALGAESVRLYYDGEAHEASAPDLPGVEFVVCDGAFWERHLGARPASMKETHRAVFSDAHATARSDWQFFCDADEFLVSDLPVPDVLAEIPAECESLRILNMEAVWGPGDNMGAAFGCTWFRTVLSPRRETLVKALIPSLPTHLFRQGFAGHRAGKQFLRRGTHVDSYNIHFATRDGQQIGWWAHDLGFAVKDLFLAHFDAVSEVRWSEKWRRRLSEERPAAQPGPQRLAQATAIAAAIAEDRLPELFARLYGLSRYEAAVLRMAGGVVRRRIF